MWEIIQSGGILTWPLTLCSVLAVAITAERFSTLRRNQIAPADLLSRVWGWIKKDQMNSARLRELRESSPLGRVLAAGLVNARHGRDLMKESIQEAASVEVHYMERYLNALGTIAGVSPQIGR